ncbi:hypothetical protein M011DRAFT_171776 [Sporormia fimetaria CBS 119925]|uniref:Uncharacterized protein n=1 Tax=Sporormia fimetaria CBS 119925 TaxID=1340428 RepID=A0A6A6V3E5_9PLEO|nr:hypothetical protein M011DRAFT_171776 [Sporormia fimetaria CBS 119925]
MEQANVEVREVDQEMTENAEPTQAERPSIEMTDAQDDAPPPRETDWASATVIEGQDPTENLGQEAEETGFGGRGASPRPTVPERTSSRAWQPLFHIRSQDTDDEEEKPLLTGDKWHWSWKGGLFGHLELEMERFPRLDRALHPPFVLPKEPQTGRYLTERPIPDCPARTNVGWRW